MALPADITNPRVPAGPPGSGSRPAVAAPTGGPVPRGDASFGGPVSGGDASFGGPVLRGDASSGEPASCDHAPSGGPAAEPIDPRLEPDVFARGCASRAVLQDVTGRWGALALGALHLGPARFNALRRRVEGVSEKMLAQTLQALERDGFVVRDVQGTIPPRVEYRLTPLGATVAERLVGLIELLEASMGEVRAAQAIYDER